MSATDAQPRRTAAAAATGTGAAAQAGGPGNEPDDAGPAEPARSADPAEPGAPGDPIHPAEPTRSADPAGPSAPGDAIHPADPGSGPRTAPGRGAVFCVAFTCLFALLVIGNPVLFSVAVHERGDAAANSILAGQAKHFHLLVGNYSRLGFAHPGPAFLYVQAFGEWLYHDVLGIVPAPWNGQALAVLTFNAAVVALALALLAGWARSWPSVALLGTLFLGYLAANGQMVSTVWMPMMYFAPFLLLLTASAGVAAGRVRDAPAMGLAAGLLLHGHAEFLVFVPAIAGPALVAMAWRHRRNPVGLLRGYRRQWLILLGTVAVFALPIALNLLLHWPGELARYLDYARSDRPGGHPPGAVAGYVLQFWPGRRPWVAAPVALVLLAAPVVLARPWRLARPWLRERRRVLATPRRPSPTTPATQPATRSFLLAGSALVVLATALFVSYTATGVDDLRQEYIGYFSRAIPLLAAALCLLAVAERVPRRLAGRPGVRLATIGLAAAALVVAAASPTLDTPYDQTDNLPQVLDLLASRSDDRSVVLTTGHDAWPELTALLIGGARQGMRLCVPDESWRFMITDEFLCSPEELRAGRRFRLDRPGAAGHGGVVVAAVGHAVLVDERNLGTSP